jgi:hypothetical protein
VGEAMTKKLFRAVLIDPELRSINAIETSATLEAIHELVGKPGLDSFAVADHETSFDHGWVDDMGLRSGPVYAFLPGNRGDPIAGRCLILGVDKETRDTTDALIPVEFLRDHIEWLGQIVPEVFWDETDNEVRAIVTYARVKA